ncbi:MAG TPA: vWA domain-containing protein, partial [Gemmataceae bacterium]|nr:vWA domain-containing protein [Gemmataceae bacterium]
MTLLNDYWFAVLALLLGGGLLARGHMLRNAGRGNAWGWLLVGGALVCFGLGGLTPHTEFGSGRDRFTLADVGFWIAVAAVVAFAAKCVVLFSTGQWWPAVAASITAVMLLGLGAWASQPMARGFAIAGRTLLSLEVVQPFWLVLLLLIPLIVKLSYRSLAGLGPTRRWLAIGLRSLLILLLVLALAELRLRRPNETTTVYFLVDRSVSIPQDLDPADELKKDQRWQRIRQFIASSVEKRGTGHERDQAGVIVFGRRPRLVLPASDVPKMNLEDDAAATIDPTYTDIAAAIKLALASFPEGTAKRIVLLSDGNENLGNAVEQARIAKENGVQIDTVTLAAGYKNENEVLVERVEAPTLTEQGARLPIRVLIRSYNPRMVTGTLALRQLSEGAVAPVAIEAGPGVKERGPPAVVQLRPGLNAFSFRQTLEG